MLSNHQLSALRSVLAAVAMLFGGTLPVYAQPGPSLIRVETINIKSNPLMALPKVKQDVEKSAELPADVVFRQEISPNDYKNLIQAHQPMGWRHAYLDMAIPISYRVGSDARWDFIGAGREKMHDFKSGISPTRWINWVILVDKTNQQRTVFLNTHFVSGAWNDKPVREKQWRKDMWNQHFRGMSARMKLLHDAGYNIVFGGDFNRIDIPYKFHPEQQWIMDNGIDKLGVIKARHGVQIGVKRTDVIVGFNSDHNAKLAAFTLTR